MTLEDTITILTDAGFIVNALYPFVIVSLNRRAVSILEVKIALNFANLNYSTSGQNVLIRF